MGDRRRPTATRTPPDTSGGPPAVATEGTVIVDRGYRHWDGERGGLRTIRWAVTVDALRRAFGLGRRARAKLFPWGLVAIGVVLALVITGLYVAAGTIGLPPEILPELPGHRDLFSWFSAIALLFVAVVGPSFLVPDRRHGTLALTLSRPLGVVDYLRGKAAAFALVVLAIQLLPQLVLWIGRATVADSIGDWLAESWPVLWQAPVVAVVTLLAQGAVLALITSWVNRTGVAAAAFLGTWAVLAPILGELSRLELPGVRYLALLTLPEHPEVVADWVFGRVTPDAFATVDAGFGPVASLAAVVVLAVLAGVLTVRRYRSLA
jgi:ABC-2 type transport system permease protein